MLYASVLALALAAAATATPPPIALPTVPPLPGVTASAAPSPVSTAPGLSADEAQKVDAIALRALAEQAVSGLSVAIVRNGRVVYSRGYGYASAELQQPARDASLYEIGSISKEFTAAAIVQLADDGKLLLDDPLAKYVPDFPRASTITLRELLTMTAGVPDFTDAPGFDKVASKPATPADIVALVKSMPPDFDPGTRWGYSNTDYVLLGMVVEKVAGTGYGSYVDTHVLQKLGMTATKYGDVGASSPDLATGYTFDGAAFKPATPWDLDWAYAAGGIVSNVLDLAVWDAALLQGSVVNVPSLRTMWTQTTLADGTKVPYGFGWSIETVDGHREIDTNGGLPGYDGRNAAFPNDRFDIVVLGNTQDFHAGPIVRSIFELFFPPTNEQRAADRQGDDAALAHARDVFARLQTGRLDASMLTPAAAARLTPGEQAKAKAGLGKLGMPLRFEQTDRFVLGTQIVYDYRLIFKQAALGFSVAFERSGAVGQLSVRPL